jgi:hypothetical protein
MGGIPGVNVGAVAAGTAPNTVVLRNSAAFKEANLHGQTGQMCALT